MPDDFGRFAGDYASHLLEDPNACVAVGASERLDELPDPSTAALEAAEAALREARSYGGNRHGQAPLPGGGDAS